jgi:hypothetical protein
MKTNLVIALFVTFFMSYTSFSANKGLEDVSENTFERKNFFYVSPFQLAAGHLQFGYERDFGEQNNSLMFNAGVWLLESNDRSREGVSLEFQYRWNMYHVHTNENATNSYKLYFGPFAQFHYNEIVEYYYDYVYEPWGGSDYDIREDADSKREIIRSYGGGVVIGNRFLFFDRLTIDFMIGGGLKYSDIDAKKIDYYSNYNIFNPRYTGVIPKTKLQIGIAF